MARSARVMLLLAATSALQTPPRIAHPYSAPRTREIARAVVLASGGDEPSSPYTALLSVAALGDAAALLVAAKIADLSVFALLASWAAAAPQLGAYDDDARSFGEAAKAPAASIALCATCASGVTGLLQGELSPQSWLSAVAATGVCIEGWRLGICAAQKSDRALNLFVRAVVDEDGGDDDF